MENNVSYLTLKGKQKLEEELLYLTTTKRQELAERLNFAIKQGDLSENADYIATKEQQGFVEGRIRTLQAILSNVILIEEDRQDVHTRVQIGSKITVREGDDAPETYWMVGPAEANPRHGKISHESPLGKALMGKEVGQTVEIEAPGGRIRFEIVGIE
ncbi:MAG: transcription elongation factor GreA [Thermoflexales bacterium]|nr:transcription elongation factor GreA [Thermoflexales bacterium]